MVAAGSAASSVEVAAALEEESAAELEELELEPEVPKGKVLAWLPFWTVLPRAGSKNALGSLAGS